MVAIFLNLGYICTWKAKRENMKTILTYLSALKENNNRIWFNEHKAQYLMAQEQYERISQDFLMAISTFDADMQHVNFKEANFRIYRDIRFSANKTPYKLHFGAFFAYPNGRKSHRGGYYLHIEPNHSFMGIGVWKPERKHLQAIRKNIYNYYDEFKNIIEDNTFVKNFGKEMNDKDKLKKIPTGFSKDFENPELLKHKNYIISHHFDNRTLEKHDFIPYIKEKAKIGYPFLSFLNEAIDDNN